MSFALIKHVAEHDPVTHLAEVDSFVNTATGIYAGVATVFSLGLAVARNWVAASFFQVQDQLLPIARALPQLLPLLAILTVFFGRLARTGTQRNRSVSLPDSAAAARALAAPWTYRPARSVTGSLSSL